METASSKNLLTFLIFLGWCCAFVVSFFLLPLPLPPLLLLCYSTTVPVRERFILLHTHAHTQHTQQTGGTSIRIRTRTTLRSSFLGSFICFFVAFFQNTVKVEQEEKKTRMSEGIRQSGDLWEAAAAKRQISSLLFVRHRRDTAAQQQHAVYLLLLDLTASPFFPNTFHFCS